MKITINQNPMPAVRMTRNTMWYGRAKDYVDFKNTLALELKLHLMASAVKGSDMVVEDKFAHNSLPVVRKLRLTAKFYRPDQRNVDIDNLLKMAMDLLQTAGIIKNDGQIQWVQAELIKGDPKPRFEMELT